MKALITGCARSGTVYTEHVFNSHGIAATHEKIFNVDSHPDAWGDHIEVAWEGAPWIDWCLTRSIPVLHQVRHPLKVISSLLTYKLFSDYGNEPWALYIYENCPEVAEGDQLERATRYWLYWNQLCHKPGVVRHRVEDIPSTVSPTTNTHGPTKDLTWSDLPTHLIPEVLMQAHEYGYLFD